MLLDLFLFLLIVVIWIICRLIMLAVRVIKKLLGLKEKEEEHPKLEIETYSENEVEEEDSTDFVDNNLP